MVTTLTFTCTVVGGAVGVVLGAFCPLAPAEDATVRQRNPIERKLQRLKVVVISGNVRIPMRGRKVLFVIRYPGASMAERSG
jgi:hypothetical protein